jgi:hypothetical protein
MRITELVENIDLELDKNKDVDFDLVDDLLFYMNHDDEVYRRHTYPSIVKYKNAMDKGEETDHLLFGSAVTNAYKKYCEAFKEKRLPEKLSRDVLNKVCHKLHNDEGNNINDGIY